MSRETAWKARKLINPGYHDFILDPDYNYLPLSPRLYNQLQQMGLTNTSLVQHATIFDLMKKKGFGRTCLYELRGIFGEPPEKNQEIRGICPI